MFQQKKHLYFYDYTLQARNHSGFSVNIYVFFFKERCWFCCEYKRLPVQFSLCIAKRLLVYEESLLKSYIVTKTDRTYDRRGRILGR